MRQQEGDNVDLANVQATPSCSNTDLKPRQLAEIAKQFGDKFVCKAGRTSGRTMVRPNRIRLRMHLVFVENRTEGRLPALAEIREAVRREWSNARRLESNEKYFQSLLKHYQVVIEQADPARAGQKVASAK